ncbi:autotransporter domain-containing protein [Sebaldella sp. S0638]|uniref:autotransporter domain-containing protein n=1 Tax=Sebaldella sp. S0638 TaxID=2957809 RepID=UPI0020A1822C|nr:transporter [Sebaldella sp. S0638]MCP1225881.1 transporter [Sebaldella sp. S0638]
MKRNKKLLVSFLALNAILISHANAETVQSTKYERMYNSIVKNIEKGNSSEKTYQTLEKILNQKNKELKDLYLQGDYIVKPEYLEWQVFFTGFYDEYNEGVDNSGENAKYHSKVTGYYDSNGNYIVTSGSINGLAGKPYLSLQQPKEIDLGIAIQVREPNRQPISLGVTKPSMPLVTPVTPGSPTVGTITPTLPPLTSFSVPTITAPTAPGVVTVSVPTIPPVVVSSFDPITPNITTPSTFTPVTLTFTPTGFGQGYTPAWTLGSTTMINNYDDVTATTPVVVTTGSSSSVTGNISYRTGATTATFTGPQTGTNASPNAIINVAGDINVAINGTWTVNNNSPAGSVRFISYNPYEVATSTATDRTFEFKGILNLNNVGNRELTGVEHQLLAGHGAGSGTVLAGATSIFKNSGTINLASGDYIVGINVDSEGTQFIKRAQTINSGHIIINSTQSIGIDFGQYSSPLNVAVQTGHIEVNSSNNYGLRVANVFPANAAYYSNTTIDGSNLGNGGIVVKGSNNVGVSLSKQIGSNLIGNISNLNVTVNGTENIGILRRSDYAQTGNMIFTGTHIQTLDFDSNASKSVLLRSDNGNITLDRNITINKGIGNNVVLQANGAGTSVINNTGRIITLDTGAKTSIGILSSLGGDLDNKGTVTVNEEKSQGIAVLSGSTGKNSGTITLNGKESLGVYNSGTYTMSSGSIISGAENSIGVYADNVNTTTISGGNITAQNGGIALYSGNNSTINLSGSSILTANQGGLLFYNHVNSGVVTGKYNITAPASANVNAGGMLLYAKVTGLGDIPTIAAAIKGAFTNPGNLTVNMAAGANVMYIDSPGGTASINSFAGLPSLTTGFFSFTGTGYRDYVMNGFDLTLDNSGHSHLDTGAYGKIQFINTNVTVASGTTVAGTQADQVAIAQKNNTSGTLAGRYIINNGTISLSGNKSVGMAGDYITMTNTATGQISIGTNSVGINTANGSKALNEGLIELNAGSVGMYGRNYFDGITGSATLGYGNDKIDITNEKDITTVSGGVTGNVTGIYTNNILNLADSTINLTATSNIDLKGTGDVVGVFAGKTSLTNAGTITVESTTGGKSVGIYGDESTSSSITGNINVSGGAGTGIYLKNSTMSNGAIIKIDNVTSGIGMYVEATAGNTSSGTNTNTILLGDNVTGMYGIGVSALNSGTITNTGTIQSSSVSANKVIGMYVGSNGIGNNSGNIYLTAVGSNEDQVGIYNSGTFSMTGGNVEVFSKNGAALYATGPASLSGGTIKTGDGAIGLYADGTTINLSGTYKSIVENGGIFALNNGVSGNVNIASGNIVVDVEAGGMAFSSTGALNTYLTTLVTGGGTLEINLKDPTSKLAILDSPGTILLSSIGTAYAPGASITPQVKISSSSNPNYTPFSITKGTLIVDQAVNLNSTTDSYNKSDFINSSVDVNSAITGTNSGQLAVGQVNYGTGSLTTDRARITLNNNNIIDLSGNNSTGILADFGNVTNTSGSLIKMNGEESVGIYAANGTAAVNAGTINMGNKSVGIYGVNQLPGTPGYGDKSININNSGNIVSTGTTHGGYGIYANNTAVPVANSVINLTSSSNIDVSGSEAGIGIYAVNSTLNIDGNITVGKDGVGVYVNGSTGAINGGTVALNGDNAIGYYLTNGSSLTNLGGSISVNGQNITLMITDAGSSINLSTPFTVTSTPGSTYVVGNMIGGDFYNNTTGTLGSNGSLINGIGTAALFGTGSNINSTGTNVSGMVLSGQHAAVPGHTVSGSGGQIVNEEGTNRGIITLGDSSAGMYLTGGARGRNEGTITINNNSVGIYAESSASLLSHIVNNNGIITIGQESTGLFLKDGSSVSNIGTAEINSASQKAVGIYSENSSLTATVVTNANKIDLSGDQSIGIYTAGANNITNSGTILIGNSVSAVQPGVGIYADNAGSSILNSTGSSVNVGDNSIGIYNLNGNITNDGAIAAGNGGTGIYSEGGTITLNTGSSITVGQNDAVGVYAVNQAGTVINNSLLSVGDGSYGFVFTGSTAPSFTNNQSAVIGNNSIFVFADSVLAADNSGTLTMTGSDNIGYYLKNGGSFVNNANITGNTGVSNIGVYAKGANIVNNADIVLGDSNLVEHTDSSGNKYKTGYSVGIYGEKSNITNNSGKTIQVGKEGIGIYVKGAGYTADNYGIINGVGDDAKGIFAADYATVNNYGTINMTGDNVMGIAGQSGAQIYNHSGSVINVTGNDVTGIYLAGDDTKLINHGIINITGTGLGISYTPTVELSNITDTTGTTQGYTSKQYNLPDMPTLVNSGVININVGGNFNYDGIRVIVTIDPATNTPTTNSSSQVGFGGVIPDKLEVAPDFAVGTAADRYIFENIFKGAAGKGEYISQSLTWDATAQGSNLVMTRKAYMDFTDGLWFEDFGRELNEKYAVTTGEGRKIYDKINYITNETDFRHVMASLAGNVYANINQREYDIAKAFEDSLHLLQDSSNNTKENIKISVIAGKGKNKEETDGVTGYDYTTTGVLALREVERTYRHTFGYSLGYVHTGFEFKDGNESEEWVDTIQLGVHNKYKANGWEVRNDLTGRASIHNVDRNIDWPSPNNRSEMDGTYETYSITSDNILGKKFELGKKASIMPYGAFKAMYVTRPSFEEKGLEALEVEGNDAWSAKPRAGVELKGAVPLGVNTAWQLKGTLDLAYEYELADLNEREKARLIAIEDGYHKLSKPEDEKGTFRTKAAIGVEVADRYGIFLTGEYSTGNDKEDDYRAGVTLKAVF